MLRRMNEALPGLVATIIGYGFVLQFTGMWFVNDKLSYSIGLWYGIAVAVGIAINIAAVLWDAVSMGESKNANRRIIAKSVLRYAVVAILLIILGYFKFGNLFAAFLGILGLKVSAYLLPLLSGLANRFSGRGDAASNEEIVK